MAPSVGRVMVEAAVVGILLVLVIYLVQFMLEVVGYPRPNLPAACSSWDQYYQMEITVFLAGALFHLICQYTGVNEWYARKY